MELDPLMGCKIGDATYISWIWMLLYYPEHQRFLIQKKKKKLWMLTKLVFNYNFWILLTLIIFFFFFESDANVTLGKWQKTILKMIKKFRDQNRNEKNVGIKIKTTQNKDKKIFSPNFYIPRRDSNWCNRIQIL